MQSMRQTFNRALVARRDLQAGHRLSRADLTARKPASAGIPAQRLEEILNRPLERDLAAGEFITEADLGL